MEYIINDLKYNGKSDYLLGPAKQKVEHAKMINESTVICCGAFTHCSIKTLEFSPNIKIIENEAFSYSNIENVYIEKQIELGYKSFFRCEYLNLIDINCTNIPQYCFAKNNNSNTYLDVTLKNTKTLEREAFENNNFSSLNLPNTLETIGEGTFAWTKFKNPVLTLPDSVKTIEFAAFCGSNLLDLYIPSDIEYISDLVDTKITLHMTKEAISRLYLENYENVVEYTLEELLNMHSFKELNKKALEKENLII